MMQLGAEGIFVGSGIFKSDGPGARAPAAIVEATTHFEDPERVAAASRELGEAMPGIEIGDARGRRRAAPAPRLVARCRSSASSPSRATSRRTRRRSSGSAPTPREVRTPADLDGLDGARHPRRRVHHDDARHRARGARRAAARLRRAPGRPVLGTCAGLIMLDRDHLGLLDIDARRNAFGRQLARFEADRRRFEGEPLRAVFIRAPWVEERGDGRRGARRGRRPPGRRAAGQHPRRRLPPRADRRAPAARAGSCDRSPREVAA